MKIIKEVWLCGEGRARFIIRTNSYGHSVQLFSMLGEEAKKDFPNLDLRYLEVFQYRDPGFNRTWGVEHLGWADFIPEGYEAIQSTMGTW